MAAEMSMENCVFSYELSLLDAGFTSEGLKSLYNKINVSGIKILENAWKIADKLNKHVSEGGTVSIRFLNRCIDEVIPNAGANDRLELKSIITEDTKFGKDIEADYYSEIPSGLAEEMRKWRNNKLSN